MYDSDDKITSACDRHWSFERARAIAADAEAKRKKMEKLHSYQEGGKHYLDMKVQPWDVIDTWPLEQRVGAYRAGALKYLMRMGAKDSSIQEIKKAIHYCEKLVEVLNEIANMPAPVGCGPATTPKETSD